MVIFADKLSDLSTATPHAVWQFATVNANQPVFVASFSESAGMILTALRVERIHVFNGPNSRPLLATN